MKRILLTGALFTAGLGIYGEAKAACRIYDYEKMTSLWLWGVLLCVRATQSVLF
ncbi:Fimbrial family protein [Acinetobacter baumannii]|nr:Fimbrial family protein [Acinetobacter baumannii]